MIGIVDKFSDIFYNVKVDVKVVNVFWGSMLRFKRQII